MKNFKFLLVLAFAFVSVNSFAQGSVSPFSTYGHSTYNQRQYTTLNNSGITKLNGFDTLVSVVGSKDTGYCQFSLPYEFNFVTDLYMKQITGTMAGTAVLMGSNTSSMPGVRDNSWHILTGSTTYCAGCAGASSVLTGSGTTQYQWHIPESGCDYQNYQIRIIDTGAVTATYTIIAGNKK